MKKVTLYTLGAICLGLTMSCKKDSVVSHRQPETSDQVLTKISRTTYLGAVSHDEVINYQYNEAGKIISEGEKTYVRDDLQRIVRILNSSICDGRPDTKVYYNDANPKEVSYTFCQLDAMGATDSVVYVHTSGRLTKTMSYIHHFAASAYPEKISLEKYNVFQYNNEGNLLKASFYSIDPASGDTVRCGQYFFKDYYNTANPLYSEDEVRRLEVGYEGLINSSKNNFFSIGRYTKEYEYRADGRPRTCMVRYNGNLIFKLTFDYKAPV
jgi:hypothetical protein